MDRLRHVGIQREHHADSTTEELPPIELPRIASDSHTLSDASALSSSATPTATFTSFPPSPRVWSSSASSLPSPSTSSSKLALQTAGSLDALTLASVSAGPSTGFATPRSSSTQSLVGMGGYDWELTARKLQTIRDADERPEDADEEEGAEERSAASALSALRAGSRLTPVSMDVDGK